MSSGHFSPAVRARGHRHYLARLPPIGNEAPSFGNDLPSRSNKRADDVFDGLVSGIIPGAVQNVGGGFSESLTTIVQTIPLLGTTLLHTQVIATLVPAQTSTTSIAASATSAQTQSSATPTSTQSSSSQSSASSVSSSSSSSSSSVSSSSSTSLSSSSATSLATSSTPTATSPLADNTSSGNASHSTASLTSTVTTEATHTGVATNLTATSKGLSGSAIGGIIAVSVIAAVIVIVFFLRKVFLRRRQNRRDTFVWPKPDFGNEPDRSNDISEKMYLRTDNLPPPLPEKPITPTTASAMITPPPMSYNSPVPVPVASPAAVRSPTLQAGAAAVSLAPAGSVYSHVRCTYIPNLPDELSVTVGEMVRVLNEFDDGWVMCVNSRNEQGVVPLECLDRSNVQPRSPGQYLGQGTGDWRMSRRASSLHGAQMPLRY